MMNTYEILTEKFEHCVSMSKRYLSESQPDLALFWMNAARGFYNKLKELTIGQVAA